MLTSSRRLFLGAGAILPLSAANILAHVPSRQRIQSDLLRYVKFGNKRAGGVGDNACGEWLASELELSGYQIIRQSYSVPYFETARAELKCGEATTQVYPQPIVMPTGAEGVSGPLIRVDADGRFSGSLEGAIALVELPHERWSSMLSKRARRPIELSFAEGAKAVVALTNGPTGKVIALNTDGRKPMFSGPVALLAPERAGEFLASTYTQKSANLILEGNAGRRSAFNFVGQMNRGKGRWLVVSTPRSGWFGCAAERGSGVAAWLNIARWAVQALPDHDLAFICNTGHEYAYLGAAEAIKKIAPLPSKTDFWLHVGANVAARNWHDLLGYLQPLPSVDEQRYLSMSAALLPLARKIFAGQVGYEAPVSSDTLSAGELTEVIKAGYKPAAGVFGIHRYHHAEEDDERCLNVPATIAATEGFKQLLKAVADAAR